MKTGTYKELKAEMIQRQACKEDMEAAKVLMEKHGIVVKIVDSRIEFCNRRIGELEKAMSRWQLSCKPHNWMDTAEGDEWCGHVCSKCGLTKR